MTSLQKLLFAVLFIGAGIRVADAGYVGPDPGNAQAVILGNQFTLMNNAIQAVWQVNGNLLQLSQLSGFDHQNIVGADFTQTDPFILNIGGNTIKADSPNMTRLGDPQLRQVAANPTATRLGDRSASYEVVVPYRYNGNGYTVDVNWIASLRDGSNYVQQRVEITASQGSVALNNIGLLNIAATQAQWIGNDDGKVLVRGSFFAGQENPMTKASVNGNQFTGSAIAFSTLAQGQTVVESEVLGFAMNNQQLRRGFEYYLNRERAAPYHQNLQYNSWYDLRTYTETQCLNRIATFGQKMKVERGVPLDCYAWDSGWDNPNSTLVWEFDSTRFPQQWANMKNAAQAQGASLGVWMSPAGGGGTDGASRIAKGQLQGYEVVNNRFQFSGPKYNARFTAVTNDFVDNQGVTYFKFDDIGGGVYQNGPADGTAADYAAEFKLIRDLRAKQPNLFVNTTTGAWHSPFYFMNADSIWRDGYDYKFIGQGSKREQYMTYRDDQVYHNVVQGSPLFPIHSLMLAGVIAGTYATSLNTTPNLSEFKQDVRDFFGMGVNLQELYISPSLMTDAHWDVLAETAKWARSNQDVFEDAHWVGGDPSNGDIYGSASWIPGKGVLMLRNPTNSTKSFSLDLEQAFDLGGLNMEGLPFILKSPWLEDAAQPTITLTVGQSTTIQLAPFQVLVWDAVSTPEPSTLVLLSLGALILGIWTWKKRAK